MIRIKLLFLVLFLCVFQLSFSSAQNADLMVFIMENNIENHLLFEKTYITQDMTGEQTKNQIDVLHYLQPSKCFLSKNSKDFNFSIVYSRLLFNSVVSEHLLNFCLQQKEINIPIYLQTENFRL